MMNKRPNDVQPNSSALILATKEVAQPLSLKRAHIDPLTSENKTLSN